MRISDWSSDVCAADLADGDDLATVDLIERCHCVGADGGGDTTAVFRHRSRIVARAGATIERAVDAARDTALAGEKAMRQLCQAGRREDRKSTRLNSSH